jgi:succinyl-CoA synthetase beta subunit
MMLFEYQSRRLFAEYGIQAPEGELVSSPGEAEEVVRKWRTSAVIKAQVLAGGRGKAGGIKIARIPSEARDQARDILEMKIAGYPVRKLFVTRAVDIVREFYLGIVVNRSAKIAECVFSASGGIDIEEVALFDPGKITRIPIDPFAGLAADDVLSRLRSPDQDEEILEGIADTAVKLYELFIEKDCSLVEINPLALTVRSGLLALDAKITIDDNGIAKHPELEALRNPEEYTEEELDAREAHLAFVPLDGDIGCMVNGAGLSMATMDLIKLAGGRPANFLDIGGSSNPQKVVDGLEILMRNRDIKAILCNIFGGITRCDDIANGIVMAKEKMDLRLPLVIRLIGTNDDEGKRILEAAGFEAFNDFREAVERVVGYVR